MSERKIDIAKLEVFAAEIEDLSNRTPEYIRDWTAQDIAGEAEVALMRLALNMREKIAQFREGVLEDPAVSPTAHQRLAAIDVVYGGMSKTKRQKADHIIDLGAREIKRLTEAVSV